MAIPKVIATAVAASILAAGPAFADSVTLQGDDQHLYVRLITNSTFFAMGNLAQQGPTTSMAIFKGNIPISNDRFVELIAQRQADPGFVERVRGKQAAYTAWWWGLSVGPFLALAAGSAIAIPFTPPDSVSPYNGARSQATTMALAGLGAAVVMVPVVLLATSPAVAAIWNRPFTAEEAVEAAQAYNQLLDQEARSQR